MKISNQARDLLLAEYKRSPKAEIQDFYKVVFQSVFGAGHLIKDPTSAVQYLFEEWENLEESKSEDLLTNISLNLPIYRLNLKRAKSEKIPMKEIADAFLDGCSKFHNPKQDTFPEILSKVAEIIEDKPFCFSREEIENHLPLNQSTNFPIMHHSQIYRALYKPRYRVIPGKSIRREWYDIFPCR